MINKFKIYLKWMKFKYNFYKFYIIIVNKEYHDEIT